MYCIKFRKDRRKIFLEFYTNIVVLSLLGIESKYLTQSTVLAMSCLDISLESSSGVKSVTTSSLIYIRFVCCICIPSAPNFIKPYVLLLLLLLLDKYIRFNFSKMNYMP